MLRRACALLAAVSLSFAVLQLQPAAWATTTSVRTDAATVTADVVRTVVLRLPAPATHLALHWAGRPDADVRLAWSADGTSFTPPVDAGRDEVGELRGDGRTYGSVQVAPGARVVRVTSDRPLGTVSLLGMADGRRTTTRSPLASSAGAAVAQPAVLPRSAWKADESLRFKADGTLKGAPVFAATRKLVVHHTDTANADPDPAATIRAIYRYHVVTQGWSDIGYNFLVDEQGRTYEGRWSREYAAGTYPSGDDAQGRGVTGAHAAGWNTGTVGVALLGALVDRDAAPAARSALVDLLAWQAARHGLDPRGTSAYTNPGSGSTITTPEIAGHRAYVATECPGGVFDATLPRLRDEVAARMSAGEPAPAPAPAPAPDTAPPTTPSPVSATAVPGAITVGWGASADGVGVTGYRVLRSSTGKPGSFALLASTTATSWRDATVRRGKTSWYQVQARDAAGNESLPSESVSAMAR